MSKSIPKQYVPDSLTPSQKAKQIKSIKEKKDRPKLKNVDTKRSRHVVAFEKKYGKKITNDSFISKNIISKTGIDKILSKGRGAYYSSGSRPNTNPTQWARARLASVIMNGPARKVDRAIWDKYSK